MLPSWKKKKEGGCSCKWTAAAVCTAVDAARWSKNAASGQAGGKVGHYTAFRYEQGDGRGRWASLEIYRGPAMNLFRRWKLNRGGCKRLDVILTKSLERRKKKKPCTNKLRLLHKPWDVSTHEQNKKEKSHPERILLCSVVGILFLVLIPLLSSLEVGKRF